MISYENPTIVLSNAIRKIAKELCTGIMHSHSPKQYYSELKYDVEQDLWLEYYKTKRNMPDLSTREIVMHVREVMINIATRPESKIYYHADYEHLSVNTQK